MQIFFYLTLIKPIVGGTVGLVIVFDNLIGQYDVTNRLVSDLNKNQLAPSMLFYGNSYRGKLTAALELARTLSCSYDASWLCSCSACNASRRLLHPYTVMLGNRYFRLEINQSSQTFLADPTQVASRFLYLRAVRKLIRRFDPFLWEEDEPRFKKTKNLIAPIEELLEVLEPQSSVLTDTKYKKLVKDIATKTDELVAILEGYAISLGQVRSLNSWARNNGQSIKVVIIEEADKMQEGARNALLKILEEPSTRLFFILISRSRGAIMPTILSRVRPYLFGERLAHDEQQILSRIFRTSGDNLDHFFNSSLNINLKEVAYNFYQGYLNQLPFSEVYIGKELDPHFVQFLEELALLVRESFTNGELSDYDARSIITLINKIKIQYSNYRQSPQSLCEQFYYQHL